MRILALELGTWSVKAVELESRFRRFDILDLHEIRLPLESSNPTESYRQAVQQLLARLPSHPEKLITSLPSSHTSLRFLPFPIKQRKQAEKIFRFELEDNIPFKIEEAIVEHCYFKTKDGSLIFAVVTPTKNVQSYIEWLRSINLDPDWLTFEGMGLANLFLLQSANKESTGSDPVLLMDIGHTKTNIAVFQENRLQLFRTIHWGGLAITQAIKSGLNIELEEAEKLKHSKLVLDKDSDSLDPDAQELVASAVQGISSFKVDLHHSLVAFRNQYQNEVKSMFITGGTSKCQGIAAFLSRALGFPVSAFDAFEGVKIREELSNVNREQFGEVLGRAFVFARRGSILFNFRQQEAAKETSLREIGQFIRNPNVQLLGKLSLVLALILFLHSFVAKQLAERDARLATDELTKVMNQTFPMLPIAKKTELLKDSALLKRFIEQKNEDLEQKIAIVTKPRPPKLKLLRQISDSFPPELKVDVNNLQIADKTMILEGVLYSGELNKMIESLKTNSLFAKVDLSQEGQRFTVKAEIAER